MSEKPNSDIIRKTYSVCSKCLHSVPAEVVEADGKIWLQKHCAEHDEDPVFLSDHPDYYRDLNDFYFSVMQASYPQRDFIVRLTERCNLECPICLAGSDQDVLPDFTVDEIKRLVKSVKGKKFDLMGCEPTVMDNLEEIIRIIADAKNIPALHSNGIELEDYEYVRRLKEAGLGEVHLQFDGFDEKAYEIIRGKPLTESKLKAFANLEKLNIPVDLVMTILGDVNEKEINSVLKFGIEHSNVKEIFFLGCRMLGRAAGKFESSQLLPDQVIDILENATEGAISRDMVRRFQKLYFALLSIFGVRKCMYIQHYLLFRKKNGGYATLDDVIDMNKMEKILDRFCVRRKKNKRMAVPLFLFAAAGCFLRPKAFRLAFDFFTLSMLMAFGFDLRKVKSKSIMLGYITACDPLIYDADISENCGKGEISRDLGVQDSGALANVLREHRWR